MLHLTCLIRYVLYQLTSAIANKPFDRLQTSSTLSKSAKLSSTRIHALRSLTTPLHLPLPVLKNLSRLQQLLRHRRPKIRTQRIQATISPTMIYQTRKTKSRRYPHHLRLALWILTIYLLLSWSRRVSKRAGIECLYRYACSSLCLKDYH